MAQSVKLRSHSPVTRVDGLHFGKTASLELAIYHSKLHLLAAVTACKIQEAPCSMIQSKYIRHAATAFALYCKDP